MSAHLRAIGDYNKYSLLFDYSMNSMPKVKGEVEQRQNQSYRVGGYYRLFKGTKIGAFLQRESGAYHDDDFELRMSKWWWANTNDRFENILIFDLTQRKLIKNWVAEIKLRYLYNISNENNFHTLKIRPGLTYFLMKDGRPWFNIFAQYEIYYPIKNYKKSMVYQDWLYFGGLYHLNDLVKIGSYISNHNESWWIDSHEFSVSSWHIGLLCLFTF